MSARDQCPVAGASAQYAAQSVRDIDRERFVLQFDT